MFVNVFQKLDSEIMNRIKNLMREVFKLDESGKDKKEIEFIFNQIEELRKQFRREINMPGITQKLGI